MQCLKSDINHNEGVECSGERVLKEEKSSSAKEVEGYGGEEEKHATQDHATTRTDGVMSQLAQKSSPGIVDRRGTIGPNTQCQSIVMATDTATTQVDLEHEERDNEDSSTSRRSSYKTSTDPSTGSFSPRGNTQLSFALEKSLDTCNARDLPESHLHVSTTRRHLHGDYFHASATSKSPGESRARRFSGTHHEIGLCNLVTKLHSNGQAVKKLNVRPMNGN